MSIDSCADTLIEIRDLLSGMHDRRCGDRNNGLSLMEMAALRDTFRRLNEVIVELSEHKCRKQRPSDRAGGGE